MSRYAEPLGRLGNPEPRRIAHMKNGVIVACRLGDPTHPHVVVVAGVRHDNMGGRMDLTRLAVELVAVVPGNVGAAIELLSKIVPQAQQRAAEGLGRAELAVDATRQRLAYRQILERMDIGFLMVCTTHARKSPDVPYWAVGRVTLLSHLAGVLARPGVVRFLEHEGDSPLIWRPAQVRDALAAAQGKPPKEEADAFVTEGTTQDDIALTVALLAMRAEDGAPDPWVEVPEYAA